MQEKTTKALFDLGSLVATPGALAALAKSGQTALDFLSRHGVSCISTMSSSVGFVEALIA